MDTDSECNCVIESLLIKGFGERTYNEKGNIITGDRPKPTLNITTSTKTFVRHFHDKSYEDINWLCGCTKMQKLFCWPCLLFSREINVWNKTGFDDLNNLSKARKRHENSKYHLDAVVKLKQFLNQTSLKLNMTGQYKTNVENYNKKVKANRYIISKLIDVICFSSKQELAFRESTEAVEYYNRGNYIELVHLLSTSDNQLKMHLEKSTVFTEFSNRIQNGLIQSLGNVLLEEIRKELENAMFVAVIVEEMTDVSKRSTVFRYMKEDGNVEERFLGFTDVGENGDEDSLYRHIMGYLEEFHCTKKLVAYTYDGSVTYFGQHNDVQAKLGETSKHAVFVHCYAHTLSLIFSQSVGYIKECKLFFQTISGLSSFFSKSPKRRHCLEEEIKRRFPSSTPIRWNDRVVNSVVKYKNELKLFLLKVLESPEKWDSETTIAARGLYHYLSDLDFDLLLSVFHQIFAESDLLFEALQKNSFNIGHCIAKISQFIDVLQKKRNDFGSIWGSLLEGQDFTEMPPSKRMKFSGTQKESYECLFHEIMDTVIQTCIDRFSYVKSLQFLSLLDVNYFKDYEKQFPKLSFICLTKIYGEFFDLDKLRTELQYLYSCPDYTGKSIMDIKNIILNDDLNKDLLKELYNLISLVFTVPCMSISVEPGFSITLKRIETFAKNIQSEEWTTSLALLSIEKELLNTLMESATSDFYDKVINDFAEKNHSIELVYKK